MQYLLSKNSKLPWRLLGCIWLICLMGCATVPKENLEPIPLPKPTAPSKAIQLQSWDIQGRIAVKTNQKGWNASFNWSQKQTHYDLNIFGPLGGGRISLIGNHQGAVLITAEKTYESDNVEMLLEQQLGWYMPVNSVYYWIRGLPAPTPINHIVRNNQGQLVILEQQGWHIEYQSYNVIHGLNLPTLMELRNPRVSIRIAISQYEF